MRRGAIAVLFALLCAALGAQQVTKVGICDWTKVLNSSFRETKAYRDYFDARDAIRKEQAGIEKEISDLENRKLDADKAGNKDLSLQLEKQLSDKRRYLEDYKRIKGDWLNQQAARLTGSVEFIRQILDVVKVIADGDGLALVIRSDGPYADLILFNIPEIDITDKVITEIFRRAGKTWSGTSD